MPRWRLTVSPTGETPVANGMGFWLLAVIVLLLLLVAVVCGLVIGRRGGEPASVDDSRLATAH